MGWTGSQEIAINDRGRSLLISAGAGSGKTTVLAERLINMLIEGGTLDNFLVVTFTKAAAGDLKEKMYKKLVETVARDPDNKRLYNQLFRLSGAQISTIHSFCFDLVKHNFNKLSIPPTCRIGDEAETSTLLNEAIAELMEERFSTENDSLWLLADTFCDEGGEYGLDEKLTDIYSKIRAFYRYDEWLSSSVEFYKNELSLLKAGFFATQSGSILRDELRHMLSQQLDAAERLCHTVAMQGDEKNMGACESLYEAIDGLVSACDDYTSLCSFGKLNIKRANYNGLSPEIKEYYSKTKDKIKTNVEKLIASVDFGGEGDISDIFTRSLAVAEAFKEVITDMDRRYSEKKISKGLLDYSDLEHFAMRLLENEDGSESAICLQLKARYKQVFIDEYQDVNPLQDRIFSFISREDNRFTVGDVKQSIYRFRNAYPDIFLGYKKAYGSVSENKKNAAIFLRENFRCDKTVIDFVNAVTDYASCGGKNAPEYAGESLIFAKSEADCINKKPKVAYTFCADGDKDAALNKNIEFVASEIKRLVNEEGYKYRDIALLFSAIQGYTTPYENMFRACGIPYTVVGNEDCLATPEVTLALSCLSAIDNPTDDISLFSMMRSPMYAFSADELYKIRRSNDAYSFCTCLKRFACGEHLNIKRLTNMRFRPRKEAEKPKRLEIKAKKFIKELDMLRDEAMGSSADRFLWSFYMQSGLLSFAAAEEDGKRKKENLLALYERAARFESGSFKGVSAFAEYMRRVSEEGGKFEIAGEATGDAVAFMTVHKSKGLEFPVCFIVNAHRTFLDREKSSPIIVDRGMGITFSLRDTEKHTKFDTPSRLAASRKVYRASVNEELRKLYVALTRAKSRLYVVGCLAEDYFDYDHDPIDVNCFMDWVVGACLSKKEVADMFEITETSPFVYAKPASDAVKAVSGGGIKGLEYVYPYSSSALPAKVSVSQLRKGLLEEEEYSPEPLRVKFKVPSFAGETAVAANEIGNANHLFMQFCDMENAFFCGAEAEAERLLEKGFITKEQLDLLDFAKLDAFFKGDLYAEMQRARQIFREKRFSISDSASLLGGDKREKILVQGVIDCFFVSDNGEITVVDYKTDRVSGANAEAVLLERHSTQLGYYCRAVEKMTGKKVRHGLIYSFALGRAVELK